MCGISLVKFYLKLFLPQIKKLKITTHNRCISTFIHIVILFMYIKCFPDTQIIPEIIPI